MRRVRARQALLAMLAMSLAASCTTTRQASDPPLSSGARRSTTEPPRAAPLVALGTTPPTSSRQPPSLEELYRSVESGVLRIVASTCFGTGVGSGFLVAPDEVVTAAHVVAGTASVAVDNEGVAIGGTVIGADDSLDVALIRLDRPLDGYVFTMSNTAPSPGASVAAIGFPLSQPKSVNEGTVSGVERTVLSESGELLIHMIQVDVPLNEGNSGGPLLNEFGDVVGVVSGRLQSAQNLNYAGSASFALPLIESWRHQPQVQPALCQTPLGPQVAPSDVQGPPSDGDLLAAAVLDTFWIYFTAINTGNYETARLRVAPDQRHPPDVFADALSTSFDFDITVHTVSPTPRGASAWVTFTSLQAPDLGPRPGESCTLWSIDYTLIPADDGLMWIEHGVGHAGGPISAPC